MLMTEATYMALLEACFKIAWLMSLQKEIDYLPTISTPLISGNQEGIFLAINSAYDTWIYAITLFKNILS
jgi:hypothetical protein